MHKNVNSGYRRVVGIKYSSFYLNTRLQFSNHKQVFISLYRFMPRGTAKKIFKNKKEELLS